MMQVSFVLLSVFWALASAQPVVADPVPTIPTPPLSNFTLPGTTTITPAPSGAAAPTPEPHIPISNFTLPGSTSVTPAPSTTSSDNGFEVDTSKAKPLPREHPAIEPALPKNVLPVPVKPQPSLPPAATQPTPPQLPTLPALPNLPSLPPLPMTPTADATKETPSAKEETSEPETMEDILRKEEEEEAKENYKERIYREKEQKAARIARRLRETHRTDRIPTQLLHPHDSQNSQLPVYLTKETLQKEIFKAIEMHDISALRTLLERAGSTTITRGSSQETPLIYATKLQQLDTVHLLIWLRTSVNQPDAKGHPALYYALRLKNKEISHLLLANDADINAVGPKDLTLFWIGLHSFSETDLQKLRFFRYANHESFDQAMLMAVKSRSPHILTMLLKNGANPNVTDDKGNTLLTLAIRYEMADIIAILRQYGATEHTHGTYYVDLDAEGTQLDATTMSHPIHKPYPLFTPE